VLDENVEKNRLDEALKLVSGTGRQTNKLV